MSGDADDQEGAPPVAVMSFHAWQEKYRSDASVVGSTYQINGRAFTIIGVAPAVSSGEDGGLGHAGYLDPADGPAVVAGHNSAD